ncbi:hypothetical protein AB1N83_011686, partial [Pleurotus pulmonarius]
NSAWRPRIRQHLLALMAVEHYCPTSPLSFQA